MEVIAYVRVSTEGQEDKYGLDVQKQAIQKYCDEHDYQITMWYEDVISGAKSNRPALARAIRDTLDVKAVVVYKKDRLSRKIEDFYYFKFKFRAKGIDVISVTDPNGDSAMEKVYEAISIAWAEQERQIITMRTSSGRKQKAQGGGYSGGAAPYGYKIENSELKINEEEAEIVRKIFKLHDEGVSNNAISKKLTEEGINTRKGIPFAPCSIRYIILNKSFYCGVYKYGGIAVDGNYTPLFEKNSDILQEKA